MAEKQQTRTADEIRDDIDQTREELGDTVEALGAKTDVKGQAKAKVEEIKSSVTEKVPAAGTGAAQVRSNPAPFAIGAALVLGFLIGRRRSR
jgi:hypothetical protein